MASPKRRLLNPDAAGWTRSRAGARGLMAQSLATGLQKAASRSEDCRSPRICRMGSSYTHHRDLLACVQPASRAASVLVSLLSLPTVGVSTSVRLPLTGSICFQQFACPPDARWMRVAIIISASWFAILA